MAAPEESQLLSLGRVVEPELMDDRAQAEAYADADFAEADTRFVRGFVERFGSWPSGELIDLGCGPGNITFRLAEALPGCRVTGVDGSPAMLRIGRQRLHERTGLGNRVRFHGARLPALDGLPGGRFDAVVSNSLLHHLHNPAGLWEATQRLGVSGAAVYCGDLRRPTSAAAVRALAERYAAGAPEVHRRDFEASLHAAFTCEEVRAQLAAAGLAGHVDVEDLGDRHLVAWGRLPA